MPHPNPDAEPENIRVTGLDHIVLTVRDMDAAIAFYGNSLGFDILRSPEGRVAVSCGNHKINLHQYGREFSPHASVPAPGSGDFCILVETDIDTVAAFLKKRGVPLLEGPVIRNGAAGTLRSVYLRDPDGNLVELANVTVSDVSTPA